MNDHLTEYEMPKKEMLRMLANIRGWPGVMSAIPGFISDAAMLVFASLMINLLALALPIFLMQIYDRIIPNSSYATLTLLTIGVVSALILETIVKILRSMISNWLSARLEHILNTEALNYFLSSRLDRFEEDNAGVHFERFNAVSIIKSYFSGQILLVLLDIPFALIFLGLLYYIGGALCYFTIFVMFIYILAIGAAKKIYEAHDEKQVELKNENLNFILETLGGIHTVKALSMEERMQRKFENIQGRMAFSGLKAHRWKAVPETWFHFFSQLNILGIIFLGADLVINGTLTIGAMTACTIFAGRGLQPVAKLAGFWLKFSEVNIAQRQLEKIIRLKSTGDAGEIPVIPDIEGRVFFDNLTVKGSQGDTIIDNFSGIVHQGETIGVSGENQDQVTALMLSLCGMYKPSSGKVFVDEYLISSMDHSYFDGRVEYLPRKGRLFGGTLIENIARFNANKRDIALDTASLLGLDTFVADLPNGYETVVDQRSNDSLPLGLIQRTSFARALVARPRILILDRTLNSMDKDTYDLACEILTKLKGQCTLFIVSDYGLFPFPVDREITCTSQGIRIKKPQ